MERKRLGFEVLPKSLKYCLQTIVASNTPLRGNVDGDNDEVVVVVVKLRSLILGGTEHLSPRVTVSNCTWSVGRVWDVEAEN